MSAILHVCTVELRMPICWIFFDIIGVDISDEKIDSFGDKEYIWVVLPKGARCSCLNTRKQLLLKTLYAYIANSKPHWTIWTGFSMFGTNKT